jgi:cathepsin D
MGFQSGSKSQATPIVLNMFAQKLIEHAIFSFWLNNDLTQSNGGELLIGGSDSNYYQGSLFYAPLTSSKSWQIQIDR